MLQTYGLNPKWFDPKNMRMDLKTFSRIDPKLLGLDPKMLQGMDSKLLQSMGINLKALGMESKTSASSSQPLYSTGSSVTTPLFYLSSVTSLLFSSTQPTTTTTPVVMPTTQRSGNCAHGISSKWENLQIEEDASTPSISRASQSSVKPKGSTEV